MTPKKTFSEKPVCDEALKILLTDRAGVHLRMGIGRSDKSPRIIFYYTQQIEVLRNYSIYFYLLICQVFSTSNPAISCH